MILCEAWLESAKRVPSQLIARPVASLSMLVGKRTVATNFPFPKHPVFGSSFQGCATGHPSFERLLAPCCLVDNINDSGEISQSQTVEFLVPIARKRFPGLLLEN